MILKAGTYRFNDELNIDSNLGEFSLPFTVNANIPELNVSSLTCNKIIINKEYSEEYFDYSSITYVSTTPIDQGGVTDENVIVYINGDMFGEVYNRQWIADGIKTHTITEDVEVVDTFSTWYIANTNYSEINAPSYLAEITYNGETIAQLNAGETAILKCKELPMETDIIVKVNG